MTASTLSHRDSLSTFGVQHGSAKPAHRCICAENSGRSSHLRLKPIGREKPNTNRACAFLLHANPASSLTRSQCTDSSGSLGILLPRVTHLTAFPYLVAG